MREGRRCDPARAQGCLFVYVVGNQGAWCVCARDRSRRKTCDTHTHTQVHTHTHTHTCVLCILLAAGCTLHKFVLFLRLTDLCMVGKNPRLLSPVPYFAQRCLHLFESCVWYCLQYLRQIVYVLLCHPHTELTPVQQTVKDRLHLVLNVHRDAT